MSRQAENRIRVAVQQSKSSVNRAQTWAPFLCLFCGTWSNIRGVRRTAISGSPVSIQTVTTHCIKIKKVVTDLSV